MMAYSELLFGGAGIVMCVTIWAVIRIGAWLLSVYPVRAEAVVEWQDCDQQGRTEWDDADVEAMALLVHEATTSDEDPAADEPDDLAEHFKLWHAELSGHRGIEKHLRRMDRWSS